MKTFDINQAAEFLGAHKETVRRLVAIGKIPGVKIGRGWVFIEQDLVIYLRSKYARVVTLQATVHRRNEQWHFTKETKLGGSASLTMDKEYREALALPIK